MCVTKKLSQNPHHLCVCLEFEFSEGFLAQAKGDSGHFENSPSFQISWIYSDVFQINEQFIHNCLPCLPAEMTKVTISVARPRKYHINRPRAVFYSVNLCVNKNISWICWALVTNLSRCIITFECIGMCSADNKILVYNLTYL